MRKATYLKTVGLAVSIQLLLVIIAWVLVFVFSPALDGLFGIMINFYWPILYIIGNLWNPQGELAGILLGLPLGIVIYGLIAGFVISLIKRITTK